MNSINQFEAIVNAHYEGLYRFALSLTRAEPDACDLTQQTLLIWATKGHQVREPAKIKTWLFTTLYRAFLAAKKKQYRILHSTLDCEITERLPANSPEPDMQADNCEVLPALVKVDAIYRAAVALYYLDGCSYKEIAAILEVPVGTVKSRIARGIAQLRDILNVDLPKRNDLDWDSSAAAVAEPLCCF